MPLPANTIKLYDRNGQLVGRLLYQGNGIVYQPCDPAPQDGDSFTDPEQPTVEGTSDHSHLILTQGSHLASSATCTHSLPDPALTPVQGKSSSKDERVPTALLSPAQENHSTPCDFEEEHTLSECTSTPIAMAVASNPEMHATPKSTLATSDACLPTHMVLTHSDDHDSEMKTTLAASIQKVLKGDNHIIREFDELRSTLKEAKKNKGRKNNLKEKVVRYNTLAAKLSLQVLARRTQLDEAIKEFEHQYFLKHGQLPKRDVCSYTELITERNHAKVALRTLNISL